MVSFVDLIPSRGGKILEAAIGAAGLLLLLPLLAAGQTSDQHRGQGYLFVGQGASSPATAHVGFGGEGFVHKGLGAGVELGYLGEWSDFSGNGLGVGSADLSYHFRPSPQHPKVEPFVSGGYTLFFLHGHTSGVNFGGGINIWLKEHAALRLEVRDDAYGEDIHRRAPVVPQHFVTFRIGLTFR